MKIICNRSDLFKGVNISLKAVPTKTTMSILECIIIDASQLEITLISNDMELGIETKVKGEIIEKGKIALEAKIFSEIIRKFPDNEVTIETDSNFNVTFSCENAFLTIPGKDGDDFSYLPYIERNQSISLSQFSLKEMIRQTIFSIGDNETNKVMTGELFEVSSNNLRVVALDRYRFSIRNVKLANDYENIKVIVPGKTLNEISKILSSDIDSVVNIFFAPNHILFEFDDTIVVSRLIEGEFIKIDQMLTKDYSSKVTINKKEFLECIDRATLFVKEGNKKPVILDINDGSMNISIKSTSGKLNENIDITKDGDNIKIGFDTKFLIDALRAIEDENISLFFINAKAPCTIRDDEGNYIYLILPMNY